MSVIAISEKKFSCQETLSRLPVKWEQFDLKAVKLQANGINGTIDATLLKNTPLSCPTYSEAGQWKHRKIFIENVLSDVVSNCPKDEDLALISLGSDRLLVEYIIGKTLLENGFSKISFLLVDPAYLFSEPECLSIFKDVMKEFRENIESIYLAKYKENFAQQRIRYLSRSPNISKYLSSTPNVVVIEGLPPYSEPIKDMKKHGVVVKPSEDLLAESQIVPSKYANAIALIPKPFAEQLKTFGAKLKNSLPLAILNPQSPFYIDWGCKIQKDGSFRLSFSGQEHFCAALGISEDQELQLSTNKTIPAKLWIPTMENSLATMLSKEIAPLKKPLAQENMTALLEKVQQVATLYMPGIECFFLADYALDRTDALACISSQASHHYRKICTLEADANTSYKITINLI